MIGSYEEMGEATVDSRHLKIWRGTSQLLGYNTKIVQDDESLCYGIWISKGFALKGPVRKFDQWNVFNEVLYGVRFIECSSYRESTVIFSLFVIVSYGKNRDI